MAEVEESKTASWSRPMSKMYQYKRDGVGTAGEFKVISLDYETFFINIVIFSASSLSTRAETKSFKC